MNQLTAANQLTLLRMVLIPPFAILLLYGYRGWALVVFLAAGITDLFDGLIARRTGKKTTLGAWLDPMADKLLLVTMFVMLTLPGIGSANRLPLVVHDSRPQPRHRNRADRRGRQSRDRPADVPSVDIRQNCHRDLHHDRSGDPVFQLP